MSERNRKVTRQPHERVSYPGKQALNKHLYRHHEGLSLKGNLVQRLEQHDELHWNAKKDGEDLGHTHVPYQDGETYNDLARRMLNEGMAAQEQRSNHGTHDTRDA